MKLARPVSDGSKVRWTLEQVEQKNPQRVRVDWLRFTLPVDALVAAAGTPEDPSEWGGDILGDGERSLLSWVRPHLAREESEFETYRGMLPSRFGLELVKCDGVEHYMTPKALAVLGHALLSGVVRDDNGRSIFWLSSSYSAEASGMDFYAARSPIVYEGAVVGYVLAGGKSAAQHNTVHFNLFGSACLQLGPFQLQALADWVDAMGGWITRTDLALDVWEGLDVVEVQQAWFDGQFDVRGKRPGQKEHGAWSSGHSRTFEVGSRGTGKLMRAYEKGDELFGHEAGDPWVRLEVEFRNNHRLIDPDVLRRPAEYFAGAYPYLEEFLQRVEIDAPAQRIPTHAEVADKTADAAVARVVRWMHNTAGPALVAVWEMGGDLVADIVEKNRHRPARRLLGFSRETVSRAFNQVTAAIAPPFVPSLSGA